jgi:hypothetical protein
MLLDALLLLLFLSLCLFLGNYFPGFEGLHARVVLGVVFFVFV